ncbi:hypothetical protein Tco_1371212 [Tanacetum coccineum]
MSLYSYNDAVSINRIDVLDVACEEYAQEVLRFSDSSTSGNPSLSLDPIHSTSSPSLTPFEEGDFILEEIEACLTNDSIPSGIDDDEFDPEGDLLLLEKLLNDDPSSPLPSKELHVEELKMIKSSIDDPPKLEIKYLPSHLEYAFLEGTNKLPFIIAKNLKEDENVRLLKVSKSHKQGYAAMRARLRYEVRRPCFMSKRVFNPSGLARSEAYCRALEARVTVLETKVRRHEWQRQAANDLAVQHIMRTQAQEAGARVDTLEDTGSSS